MKGNVDSATESSGFVKSLPKLPELLNFFKSPIVLLLAVLIATLYLKNKTFNKKTRYEDFDDFENLDDDR